MPVKAYYAAEMTAFLKEDPERILGMLTEHHQHSLEQQQRWAWLQQISILKRALADQSGGRLFLEFYIPRMGKRADAVFVHQDIVFVIEFKVGASEHASSALEQVQDYALDLKNFHEGSHSVPIVPVLVSTRAPSQSPSTLKLAEDLVASPIGVNEQELAGLIYSVCAAHAFPHLDIDEWIAQGYKPTPTIIEAASVLYRTHEVVDISRSDAGAINLQKTSASIGEVIDQTRLLGTKAICFITGVPGSGKTLAGLDLAT